MRVYYDKSWAKKMVRSPLSGVRSRRCDGMLSVTWFDLRRMRWRGRGGGSLRIAHFFLCRAKGMSDAEGRNEHLGRGDWARGGRRSLPPIAGVGLDHIARGVARLSGARGNSGCPGRMPCTHFGGSARIARVAPSRRTGDEAVPGVSGRRVR